MCLLILNLIRLLGELLVQGEDHQEVDHDEDRGEQDQEEGERVSSVEQLWGVEQHELLVGVQAEAGDLGETDTQQEVEHLAPD